MRAIVIGSKKAEVENKEQQIKFQIRINSKTAHPAKHNHNDHESDHNPASDICRHLVQQRPDHRPADRKLFLDDRHDELNSGQLGFD